MNLQEQVFQLRQRIAVLEGQKAAAEAELRVLLNMPCPNCHGAGSLTQKSQDDKTVTYYSTCNICNGTGKACGARQYYGGSHV